MSRTIRWGILSTAQIGEKAMIPAIRAAGGEVAAVASRGFEKAQAFADKLGIPRACGSYGELLADPDIDAVYNPLPVSLHAEWSIKAAEAGKPVLCEKPLALNTSQAQEMVQAFAARGLLLSEALMYPYHALTRKVCDLVAAGAIGRLVMVNAQFNAPSPAGNIRRSAATGGGAMLDIGCYCLSIMRRLAGEEPCDIVATGQFERGVDIGVSGALRFPSGVTGHFGVSLDAAFDCSYEACGSEGRILADRGAMCAWPGEAFRIRCWHGGDYEEIETEPTNPYQNLVEDFQRALTDGEPMFISLEDTLANMRCIDTVLAAAQQA